MSTSSTSGINPASGSSNMLRLTGMASGLDVDAVVKSMISPYQTKVDKLNQDMQKMQWTQDSYRDTMSDINTFKSSFLDITKPTNYMLTQNAYATFDSTVTDPVSGMASSAVSVTGVVGAASGSYSIDFTGGHLASNAAIKSGAKIQTDSQITNLSTGGALSSTKLSELFGTGSVDTSQISIAYNNGSGAATATVNITAGMSVSDFAQAINAATSNNVVAQYSELTGKFSIQTTNTGASTSLSITDSGSPGGTLLTKLNIGVASGTGQDLSVIITPPGESSGVPITKSSNKFTIDGVSYNFAKAINANITLTPSVQKTYDGIKGFIDKYNDLIDKISTKINENKLKDYPPLTAAQKSSMSSTDIASWETKAKTGLLSNDSMLGSMLTSMRSAFYQAVQGAGVTLSQIGLSTSSDISQGGKILIDETKLKSAIQNNGQQVANIFSKVSTSIPNYSADANATDRATRSSEEGIFQRINDIMQDYTRTTRDSLGHKGSLVDKAGIIGDFTEFNNTISSQQKDQLKAISDMTTKMNDKQTYYYNIYSKLEVAMNKLNSQSASLASMLGTSSGG